MGMLQIITVSQLLKYSPDQERDDHGRFAGGTSSDVDRAKSDAAQDARDVAARESSRGIFRQDRPEKINVLGGRVTLGGDVVPAANALKVELTEEPRVFPADVAPGFQANLAIQRDEDRAAKAVERDQIAAKIGAHPPTWLAQEKHADWKATAERNKPTDYRRAALIFKAHEAKVTRAAMHATAERATKIRETREMFAERWRNKQ